MGLFDALKPKPKQTPLKRYSFAQAPGFKGFKKFHIVVYGDAESERNNVLLKDSKMEGRTITFLEGKAETYKEPFWLVYVDEKKIGSVFNPEQVAQISNQAFDAVYIKFESKNVYAENGLETRIQAQMFVRYK